MHKRLHQPNLILDLVLEAQAKKIIVKFGLFIADQTRQRDGCTDIGERVVGMAMVDPVGRRQPLEFQGDPALFFRPDNALGA